MTNYLSMENNIIIKVIIILAEAILKIYIINHLDIEETPNNTIIKIISRAFHEMENDVNHDAA